MANLASVTRGIHRVSNTVTAAVAAVCARLHSKTLDLHASALNRVVNVALGKADSEYATYGQMVKVHANTVKQMQDAATAQLNRCGDAERRARIIRQAAITEAKSINRVLGS